MSSPARTLGSWVLITLKSWMSVFVLLCVQVAFLRRANLPSKESYRLCIGLINSKKAAKVQQRAVEPKRDMFLLYLNQGNLHLFLKYVPMSVQKFVCSVHVVNVYKFQLKCFSYYIYLTKYKQNCVLFYYKLIFDLSLWGLDIWSTRYRPM
jgi:hypothetical protein